MQSGTALKCERSGCSRGWRPQAVTSTMPRELMVWINVAAGAQPGLAPRRFDDLARRFETPDSRNRWDAPLFTLRPAGGSRSPLCRCQVSGSTRAGTINGVARLRSTALYRWPPGAAPLPPHGRWHHPTCCTHPGGVTQQCQDVLAAAADVVAGTCVAPGSAAGASAATGQVLQPTPATGNPSLLGTNVLHEIDTAAQVRRGA